MDKIFACVATRLFWHGDNNAQCFGWSVACGLLVRVNVKRLALRKSVGCCLVLGCRFGQRTSVGEPIALWFSAGLCFPGEYARVWPLGRRLVFTVCWQVLTR